MDKRFVGVQCESGIWWFISPSGKKFISTGINHVEPHHLMGPYNMENTLKKYGEDFLTRDGKFNGKGEAARSWIEEVKRDFREWGFNTFAYHTMIPTDILSGSDLYYIELLRMLRLETYIRPTARPDVFSEKFRNDLENYISIKIASAIDINNMLGYCYSDTAEWAIGANKYLAHSYEPVPALNPWVQALCSQHRSAPAKKVWIDILMSRYRNIETLSKVYRIDSASWDALFDVIDWLPIDEKNASIDSEAMMAAIAEKWFSLHYELVRKYDGNHLILGEKLNGNLNIPEYLLPVLRKYVDVINIQWYGEYEEQFEALIRIYNETDKPILMGDSSFAVIQKNQKASKGVIVRSQEEVGKKYYQYLKKLMRLPFIVGWHHCGYMEGWAGLEKYECDNEYADTNPLCSTQCGFKDPLGNVHQETIQYVIEANMNASDWHQGKL